MDDKFTSNDLKWGALVGISLLLTIVLIFIFKAILILWIILGLIGLAFTGFLLFVAWMGGSYLVHFIRQAIKEYKEYQAEKIK